MKQASNFDVGCVHTNPDFFETTYFYSNSFGRGLTPLWGAVSKQCGFGECIRWFRVDRRPIRVKSVQFQKCQDSCGHGLTSREEE